MELVKTLIGRNYFLPGSEISHPLLGANLGGRALVSGGRGLVTVVSSSPPSRGPLVLPGPGHWSGLPLTEDQESDQRKVVSFVYRFLE